MVAVFIESSSPAIRQAISTCPSAFPTMRVEGLLVERDRCRVLGHRRGAERSAQAERQQRIDHDRERRRGAQRPRRVRLGVVVLGRERRHRLEAVGRPPHEVEPRQRQAEAAARADLPGHVVARPVARDVGQEHQRRSRQDQQAAGHVAEPHGRPHAEDVEEPDGEDAADADPDRQVPLEVADVLGERRVREPLGLGERADHVAVDREDARPREPVAERRDGPDERQVLAPRLVRVEGDAAGLLREHRRHLGIDVVLKRADQDRDRPQDEGTRRAQNPDRGAQRRDQEPRVGQCDDEAVPPRHRLEELSLLYLGMRHGPFLSLE